MLLFSKNDDRYLSQEQKRKAEMMRRLMGSDEPTRAPQPAVEENFNIFDDEEEAESQNSEDVSDLRSIVVDLFNFLSIISLIMGWEGLQDFS